jgi:hypothetical protein
MKKLFLFIFLCISAASSAQSPLLVEDFDYSVGDLLTTHGWNLTGTSTTNPIAVTSPGLTFSGYVGSNIGLAAGVNNTGQDLNKLFTAQSTGSVYASFLVNATATSAAGDYFFHFYDPTANTAFRARTFISPGTVAGKMKVGLTFNASTSPTNMVTELNYGQTYLFVAKYTIIDGALNDAVSLYVFAAGDDFSSEPATPTIGPLNGTAADITPTGVSLRQFDAAQRITVDGIRVKTNWNLVNDLTTSVNSLNGNQTVNYYPNPVTDGFLNIVGSANSVKQVEIFDLVGKKVISESTLSNRIDVSQLKAGIYALKVGEGSQVSSTKLVVK